MRGRRRGGRTLLLTLAALAAGSCFLPIPRAMRPPEPVGADSAALDPAQRDSIAQAERETARQDSIVRAELEAARRDSIARAEREAARRDSIARAERAAAARRDSILQAERAAAVRDSLEAARRDSLTAAARRDSLAAIETARAAVEAELAELRESGPAYVAVDEAPRLVWDTDAEAALATTLLPVIRAEGLDADIAASIWLLVRTDGRVEATAIQVSSGDQAFDAAAVRAARALLFAPALRDGRPAPVWVLREISLLMR
ncbi:MAG: TonB family protein [Gemmatimonadota bacterium]|uniref:TonB family protein n=1 Tax=Candidatus Palauibacter scopulicola TaxID=3056741 RepID=UPI00239C623B|nr:TonB family protein [Candidatus Palauibacter scopulicola]MDE2661893.1 TonB family protein [Candidatus Palauibacter scopulicola]